MDREYGDDSVPEPWNIPHDRLGLGLPRCVLNARCCTCSGCVRQREHGRVYAGYYVSDGPRLDFSSTHGSCCARRCGLRPATHATPKGKRTHIWPACTGADRRTVRSKGSAAPEDSIRNSSDNLTSLSAARGCCYCHCSCSDTTLPSPFPSTIACACTRHHVSSPRATFS